jgi:hypothetical protein
MLLVVSSHSNDYFDEPLTFGFLQNLIRPLKYSKLPSIVVNVAVAALLFIIIHSSLSVSFGEFLWVEDSTYYSLIFLQ